MNLLDKLNKRETKIAVVGLGYVGMPLAVAFAKHFSVIGYDMNKEKIAAYKSGHDMTNEVGDEALKNTAIEFTTEPDKIAEAKFVIIAVPTPIHGDKTPDLTPVKGATKTVGEHLAKGALVVYESTVYPGVTEDICCPILEEYSGLKCGVDFKIGYSPERINPGDKVHRLENIVKIVSGMDDDALSDIADVYDTIIDVTYKAPTIKVAEAAKLVENAQRDINIAFMNELSMVFHRMDIETNEVIKAMNTKWNALGFKPGLVGGHCIGVDPYYFIYQAENLGYNSQIIAAGRRINNSMSDFVAQETIKTIIKAKLNLEEVNVYLLGVTFKENTPDVRNSRSADVYRRMLDYGFPIKITDPLADNNLVKSEYGDDLIPIEEVHDADCLVVLVAHDEYKNFTVEELNKFYRSNGKKLLIDVKCIYSRKEMEKNGFTYWSL